MKTWAKIEVTEDELAEHIESCDGVCLSCGEWSCGGVEPDARGYVCGFCDKQLVFGAEEALIGGRLILS